MDINANLQRWGMTSPVGYADGVAAASRVGSVSKTSELGATSSVVAERARAAAASVDQVDISPAARSLSRMTGTAAEELRARLRTDGLGSGSGRTVYGLSRNQAAAQRDLSIMAERFPGLSRADRAEATGPSRVEAEKTASMASAASVMGAEERTAEVAGVMGATMAMGTSKAPDAAAVPAGAKLPEAIGATGERDDETENAARSLMGEEGKTAAEHGEGAEETEDAKDKAGKEAARAGARELTEDEQRQVDELKARDTEVRIHEQAHISAGGQYVKGGASYEYQQGPDGKRYAVGGEVSIDTSAESDPAKTIEKMQTVRSAALAPAQPSSQDRSVAAAASMEEMKARQELAEQQRAEQEEQLEKARGGDDEEADSSEAADGSASAAKAGEADAAHTGTDASGVAAAGGASLTANESSGVLFGGKTAQGA